MKPTTYADRSGGRGFTLMEMLLVVVVLGVLTSLLFPALGAARIRAQAASCRNNLAQMGKALAMYVGDFHRYPGTRSFHLRPGNAVFWELGNTNLEWAVWSERLQPYLGNSADVFACPGDRLSKYPGNSWTNFSYGYNAYGSGLNGPPMQNLGLGRIKPPDDLETASPMMEVAESKVKSPSDMAAIMDLGVFQPGVVSIISIPGRPHSGPPDRHGKGANGVFCDGHVEFAASNQWNAATSAARRRWNNDNEPHPETW